MMRRIFRAALALALLPCIGIAAARAQVVSDPTVIRTCLCEQQLVAAMQQTMSARRDALESSRRSEAALASQVETRRTQVNVYDSAEIDAFKNLLQQRDAARSATVAATQSYDDAATRYNQAIDAYKASCAGHSFDANVLHEAQATLACPRP